MLNFISAHEPTFDYSDLVAHELANLLPMIDDVNFANLKADIEKNGILEPIPRRSQSLQSREGSWQTNAREVQDVRRQLCRGRSLCVLN